MDRQLCAGAAVHMTGKTMLSEMGGLARRQPFLTAAFTVGCAAIAGVPPLNGYSSLGLIHDGLHDQPVVFVCALIAQVSFEYVSAETVVTAVAEIVVGLLLAVWSVRSDAPARGVHWLRRLHTGSVHDYAAFSALGLAVSAIVLLASM